MSPLFSQVNLSPHSSIWNGPNLCHLFSALYSEVRILTAFDFFRHRGEKVKLSVGIFKLVILNPYSTVKFQGGVAVHFFFKVPAGFIS